MFGMWDVWEVGCSGCGMFGRWDVREVGCSGCGMWDVCRDVGCWFTKYPVQIEAKPKNNLVIQLNTAAFQFILQKMLPFLIQNERLQIEMKQTLDAMQNVIQDTFKIYSKQSNRRSKHYYKIICYQTTSNILINGPGVTKFMNNELKLIAKILEDNKIQINIQNMQLKSILYNITTDASHKESKSNTTTNTMNESKTCIE